MSELKNDRLLRALLRQPVDVTPVWMMRQAGRYLPEYRATRQQAGSFLDLCKNAELACEVTLQPLRRYPLDAAIIFSDILTIPDAMGLGLHFVAGEGPKFEHPVTSVEAIRRLPRPDVAQSLRYVTDAVSLTRREIGGKVPLIGFSGSPWTLATYMIEGGSSKTFGKAKRMLYQEPAAAHELLGKLADTVTDYLNAQIEAGADGIIMEVHPVPEVAMLPVPGLSGDRPPPARFRPWGRFAFRPRHAHLEWAPQAKEARGRCSRTCQSASPASSTA